MATIQVLPGPGRKVRLPHGPVIQDGVTTEPQTVALDTFTLRRLRDGDLVEVPDAVAPAPAPPAPASPAPADPAAPAPGPVAATEAAARAAAAKASVQAKG